MSNHAIFSPSSSSRWLACVGSVAQSQGIPDESSIYADEGTAAHFLASEALNAGVDASHFIGRTIEIWVHPESDDEGADWARDEYARGVEVRNSFDVGIDMAAHVQTYIDAVRGCAQGHEWYVEQDMYIGEITGEEGATGTADFFVITSDGEEIQVHDLKFGQGKPVHAENNTQLRIYGLAGLAIARMLGYHPKRARLVIHQPRVLNAPDEWDVSVEDLEKFGEYVHQRTRSARIALEDFGKWATPTAYLVPGEEQCKWCPAGRRNACPALDDFVADEVEAQFKAIDEDLVGPSAHVYDSPERLSRKMKAVPLIEVWAKGVRAEIERRLLNAERVPDFKLVQGKKGPRQWKDPGAAEKVLKGMRLKREEMYDFKVISPTTAEKLHKAGKIGDRQWPKLTDHITQSEGGLSVAPESDKRPAVTPGATEEDFDVVADNAEAMV